MMFLAQLNLAEMMPLPDFPQEGLLQFYVKNDDCYGLCGRCVVKYIPEYKANEEVLVCENPYSDDYKKNLPFSDDCKITFIQEEVFIGADILLFQLDVDDTSGLMFGDSGNCTFIISFKDLLAGNFSEVNYDWQCC